MHVNLHSHVPITTQIVEQLQGMIATGVIKSGDKLPTVRALASELRINFNTVARAYRLLDATGLITTQRGRGTFALEIPSPTMSEHLRQRSFNASGSLFFNDVQRLGFGKEQAIAKLIELAEVTSIESQDQ